MVADKEEKNLTEVCQAVSTDMSAPREAEIAVRVHSTRPFHGKSNLLGSKL